MTYQDPSEAYTGPKYFGKYKGFVRRNDDPENRGRLMLYCPQVMGTKDDADHWVGWAEACLPWVGGLNTIDFGPPSTKDQNEGLEVGVWVEFEGGIPDFPVWVGTFIPAPLSTSPGAQLNLTDAAGITGGTILSNPPAGSTLGDLNPPKPILNRETRLMTKKGRDLVLGSQKGGYMILGASGVHLVGVQVTLNGRLMTASTSDSVVG